MVSGLKCGFCGREVKDTVHSKKLPEGYQVDYYLVLSGSLSPMIMKNPRDEREVLQFYRLEDGHPVIACRECYEKQEVKEELERAFKEVPEAKILEEDEEEE